jgi:predicted GIY-YIG superfamily endonuclease
MAHLHWQVYVLRCADGSLYTGITNDIARRLRAHGAGNASRYTRSRLPVEVVYLEQAASRASAQRREAAIKALPRAAKLKLVGTTLG